MQLDVSSSTSLTGVSARPISFAVPIVVKGALKQKALSGYVSIGVTDPDNARCMIEETEISEYEDSPGSPWARDPPTRNPRRTYNNRRLYAYRAPWAAAAQPCTERRNPSPLRSRAGSVPNRSLDGVTFNREGAILLQVFEASVVAADLPKEGSPPGPFVPMLSAVMKCGAATQPKTNALRPVRRRRRPPGYSVRCRHRALENRFKPKADLG